MAKSEDQKIVILAIRDILRMYSDEEHPMSTRELSERLYEHGIAAGRKIIYEDIELLNKYGYEILTVKSRSNLYYVVDRKFDVAELKILLDTIQTANFITEKKTKELTEKVASLAGFHRAKLLTKNIVYSDMVKHSNEKVYYFVDEIDRAILNGKKVAFLYFDMDCHGQRVYRRNGEKYIVNPVSLIFNENKYYLTCYNDKYKNLSNYRIDRMDKVEITDEPVTPADCALNFNANVHKKQSFSMFIGEKTEKVTFSVSDKILDEIFDRFGEKTKFIKNGDGYYKFSTTINISPTFFGWCAQLGDKIKILAPESVAESYKNYIKRIVSLYEND